ncbi:sialate O-acetylesterase [Kordia sp.]|uniref:T9SS type A sorting domain-containing protein n=1 Tax=Kordia sp. TaxID=1965332 RepID=UPI003D6B111F
MRSLNNILLFFIVLPYCVFSQVSIHEFPEDFQLYKRDVASNTATINISGEVEISSGFSIFILEIYKDNVLVQSLQHPLSYTDNVAHFEFSENITAGLFQYEFKLKTNIGLILKEAHNVVAGDIYIINGQSNAIRNTYGNTPFPYQNNFIRTFLLETQEWSSNPNPFIFGGIGYHFASSIIANQNVPVLLLNGGEGGKAISHFLRNNENILDQNTNYGRLLSRYNLANFTSGDVRGIVWFQGESNAFTSTASYSLAFNNLYETWEEDYAPDQYYVFQVRYGCTVTGYPDYKKNFQSPETHRRLGLLPNTKVISSNAIIKGYDDCHYYGTDGYANLAKRLYDLVAYDFYNSANDSGIYSPNIDNVRFADAARNQIKFDLIPSSDVYSWQNGVENDFWIEGNDDIVITDGCILGNTVTLNLSESITEVNPKLSYLGHNPNSTPFIINQNGIGMLSFKDIDISDSLLGNDQFSLNDFSMYPNPATEIVTIEWESPCNSTILIYDVTGKKVYDKKNHTNQQIKIDVSNLSSGQYFVKVINQFETTVKMMIID